MSLEVTLRKHVQTGLGPGADVFVKKPCELLIAPQAGMTVAWSLGGRRSAEQITEVCIDLDTDSVDLWTPPDTDLTGPEWSGKSNSELLDALSVKMRDLLNAGWLTDKR